MPFVTYQYNFQQNELCRLMDYEDFSPNSVITVQYGQEAVVVKDGVAVGEPFLEGRHVLDSTVLDSIAQADRRLFGDSSFHIKVYYVNIDRDLTLNWGTEKPFTIDDTRTGYSVKCGAYGKFSIAIKDSKLFVLKTVGQMSTNDDYTTFTKFDIQGFILSKCQEIIRTTLAQVVRGQKIAVFDLDMHLMEVADLVRQRLEESRIFANYGFSLKNFSVGNISVSDEDYQKIQSFDNEFIDAQKEERIRMFKERNDLALKRQEKDDSLSVTENHLGAYEAESRRQVLTAAAENEASGQGMNLGLGLAYAQSFGQAIGGMMNSMNNPPQQTPPQSYQQQPPQQNYQQQPAQQQTVECPACHKPNMAGAKFCAYCGTPMVKEIYCPKCGAPNKEGSLFCSACGGKLVESQNKKICPQCGVENEATSLFCSACGTRLA